ncbi:MAG: hypothetical protein EU541_05865 [Promethearchaeota archaeon]|nr:MAG: hypothetical protein EU541_05865 [Candidatus Lokiarchaeota archaeon]
MKTKQTPIKIKKILVDKLLNAQINISPPALQVIIEAKNPMGILENILKETRFLPSFNSNLTIETLRKISNKEIKFALRRAIDREIIEDIQIDNQDETESNKVNEEEGKKPSKEIHSNLNNTNPVQKKRKISKKPQITQNSNYVNQKVENATNLESNIENKERNAPDYRSNKEDFKNKEMNSLSSAKSEFHFNPIAKEYEVEYEIKKDPTGKLFTSGGYDDFYDVTIDKFKRLKKLMKKRPETHSSVNIKNIQRYNDKTEVSTIGLVFDHRRTKNGHYFFVLEDLTGKINVLVRKDSENHDLVNLAEKTIDDQMLFVRGTYKPGTEGRKGIIFANTVSKIDIPTERNFKTSPLPLSIALISDAHIGSKEFNERLWNKFIEFLKGQWGNKQQREIAQRIKYIIINGDLIDGIGVYPSQKEDLVISDIYDQYKKARELLEAIPEYIKIFYSAGNHEPVRNAVPRPAVPKKYCQDLLDIGIENLGNPCVIQTHNVDSLVYHGDSLLDLNLTVPGLKNENPAKTMKELLICRHLAPLFGGGSKTQIAPTEQDWMVIDDVPEIFHTGHMHINGYDIHRGVHLINSGCFQSQTEFMKSLGIHPTPGVIQIMDLNTLNPHTINLNSQ